MNKYSICNVQPKVRLTKTVLIDQFKVLNSISKPSTIIPTKSYRAVPVKHRIY